MYTYIYILIYSFAYLFIAESCKCHMFAFKHLLISSEAELMANDMFLARFKNRRANQSPKKSKEQLLPMTEHTHHQRSRRYAEPYVPAPGMGTVQLCNTPASLSANPCRNDSTVHPTGCCLPSRIQGFRSFANLANSTAPARPGGHVF